MKRTTSLVLAVLIMTTGGLLQAQMPEVEPSLTLPINEKPGEPGG